MGRGDSDRGDEGNDADDDDACNVLRGMRQVSRFNIFVCFRIVRGETHHVVQFIERIQVLQSCPYGWTRNENTGHVKDSALKGNHVHVPVSADWKQVDVGVRMQLPMNFQFCTTDLPGRVRERHFRKAISLLKRTGTLS